MSDNIKIGEYRFHGIERISQTIFPKPPDFNPKTLHYTVNATQGFNPETKICAIRLHTIIQTKDEEKMLAEMVNTYGFEFFELDPTYATIHPDDLFPEPLVKELVNIAIHTNRGLIFGTLAGSYLQRSLFPLVKQLTTLPG